MNPPRPQGGTVATLALLVLLLSLFAGCAGLDAPPPPRPARASIDAFTLTGRLSVHQEEKSYQAGIEWQHGPQRDEILLSGPLGQGLARLERDAGGARLTTSDHKVVEAADGDALARQMLGFELPLSALPDWVLGRPRDLPGWRIEVLRYESAAADALPQLLELRHGELTVRLRVDEWQLPGAPSAAPGGPAASTP